MGTKIAFLLFLCLASCRLGEYTTQCEAQERTCIVEHPQGKCTEGELKCNGDGDGVCKPPDPKDSETGCNGKDDNCNGHTDEGFPLIWSDEDDKGVYGPQPTLQVRDSVTDEPNTCYVGRGVCRRRGTVGCNPEQRGSVCFAPQVKPEKDVPAKNHPFQNADPMKPDVNNPWDWDCDGTVYRYSCSGPTCDRVSFFGDYRTGSCGVDAPMDLKVECKRYGSDSCGNQWSGLKYCGACGATPVVYRCQWDSNKMACVPSMPDAVSGYEVRCL